MARPLILPLSRCSEVDLVGGKAAGLGRLLAAGFSVPPGICLTTETYVQYVEGRALAEPTAWSRMAGLSDADRASLCAEYQRRIRGLTLSDLAEQWNVHLESLRVPSDTRWAVRSSATNEDAGTASFAGLYRTHLGLSLEQIEAAVTDLWASMWTESVVRYRLQHPGGDAAAAMAIVIQPTMPARVAGVCSSIHPVTGRSDEVTVNAVPGLAAPMVDGRMAPDQYVIQVSIAGEPVRIQGRSIAAKTEQVIITADGLRRKPINGETARESSLSDEQLFTLARMAKRLEGTFGYPIELEWLFDEGQLWLVQARPITAVPPSSELRDDVCEWTRANFKETMPEIPSPLGLSFLRHFMEAYILAHYRRLGCRIPQGLSTVRVLHGRPYLNATLFHILIAQLGGEPSLNAEHMGGIEVRSPPNVKRMAGPALLRAGWRVFREMRRCERNGPTWFADMKQQALTYRPDRIRTLSLDEINLHLDRLGRWLDEHEVTFGIVAAVGHCLQAFSRLLPGWLGSDWRSLFNASLQGQGTIISAQQIARVAELAKTAKREAAVLEWFRSEPWDPACVRQTLAGTQFLRSLEGFFNDYGHRAVGESDVMTPRMAEQPDAILAVIRAQVRTPAALVPDVHLRQAQRRLEALAEIKRRLGWQLNRWLLFGWWYRRLTRFFALREANRHHLMYYSAAARTLLLRAGELLAGEGRLEAAEDIFFVTLEERAALIARDSRDWKGLVRTRRAERMNQAAVQVPDTVRDWNEVLGGLVDMTGFDGGSSLRGVPISAGVVTAPVRLVRSPGEWSRIEPGHIIVAPVIDPGMAPLFALAGGLIVEIGGTLSHGAIIAREYGLPAVVNVEGAMTRLHDGQRVTLDADAGTIRIESSE